MPWVFRGLRDGLLTTGWPRRPDPYFDRFPAAVDVAPGPVDADLATATAADCPTRAITIDAEGSVTLDQGRCILCGRCVTAAPQIFAWRRGAATSTLSRERLLSGSSAPDDFDDLAEVRAALHRRVRRLRRSVHIRHVDAGSDGSDEWEVRALLNPVYDIHRLGIFFTASPRHADILLITGIGSAGMTHPLARTVAATPEPRIVIAAGTDAVSGGLIGGGYASASDGLTDLVDVDVWIPGSPPSPFSLLHGILSALDRLPADERGRS
ncbi:NADH:ubiquinone oxidoreductase [Gordonia sp. TBRC 11910]|uniref:NADH:ubiquinone oxidoreductase n=1 Tax=Gordonia asplenii TaxID=2725283 RepID=A0A848L1A7_9ACTN|nr:NADH:ubiquinone oxidoreductase [Gordonia asplenii]